MASRRGGASWLYGDYRLCAAIVGHADLRFGSAAGEVLDALQTASPRFVGIRHQGAWDWDVESYPPALTCVEAFGPDRAMFESNYPPDRWGASYRVLWNTFKRIAAGCSADEKHALFAGTAARVYGIEHTLPA